MFDPQYQPPAVQQAGFQFSGADPLGYLARIKAMQDGQNPQNQISSAVGTTGTDLAALMEILRRKKMMDALQLNQPQNIDYNWQTNAQSG